MAAIGAMATFSLRELEARPAKFQGPPPTGTKNQSLPWSDLPWEHFEKLCWRLAKEEQDPRARPYGVRGQDQQGIDIIGQRSGDDRITVYQCKRVDSFTATDIRKAIDKFRQGDFFAKSQRFVLCCTQSLDGTKETDVLQSPDHGIEIETWDAIELNRRLKTRHDLVEDFFNEHWVQKFCIGEPQVDYAKARKRLEPLFSTVDFSGVGEVQDGGPQSRIENPQLDDAYYEIRFQRDNLRQDDSEPAPITVQNILDAQDHCRIVKGRGGSGKSMWLRYTFRQMVRRSDVFPLLIELRDYSLWREKPVTTDLDTFLQHWLKDRGVANPAALYKDLVEARHPDTPALVLLVDGWDELGALGHKFSEQLQSFRQAYPRARIIVTSRPYGEQKPTHRDGFSEWELAPLTPNDIEAFSRRFYAACYPGDLERADAFYQRFLVALKGSQTAPQLAQLPLLLVMMLMISRTEVLPDKRHKLYERVIRNLLEAIPRRQEETGVRLGGSEWRPDDTDLRFRVICDLAFQMKSAGTAGQQELIRFTWERAEALLPAEWQRSQRTGFLFWLCSRTGILMDHADNSVQFAHLSFQEYLAAAYAEANFEGAERVQFVRDHLANVGWWESIRLWAASVHTKKPANLTQVLEELFTSDQGLTLAGSIIADGTASAFSQRWAEAFVSVLLRTWCEDLAYCSDAFLLSSSAPCALVRSVAEQRLKEGRSSALQWLRVNDWLTAAGIQELDLGGDVLCNACVKAVTEQAVKTAEEAALTRCWTGGTPFVGGLPFSLLHTWPTRRRSIGSRLQMWIAWSCDLPISDHVRGFWTAPPPALARDLAHHFVSGVSTQEEHTLATKLALDIAGDLGASDLINVSGWIDFWVEMIDLAIYERPLAWASFLATDRYVDCGCTDATSVLEHFQICDMLAAAGRASARFRLARVPAPTHPVAKVLHQLAAGRALAASSLHPLWYALGRHLGRRSTPEDKALLEDYARHPEKMDDQVLQWGLRFIVRGDLMLPDGSFQTLDELADQHGLPHLPYLEDVPEP